MVDSRFFANHGPLTAGEIASVTGTTLQNPKDAHFKFSDVAPLDRATAKDISFFDNAKYTEQFINSQAGACFLRSKYAEVAPKGMVLFLTEDPYRCYALTAQKFYPVATAKSSISLSAQIDATAKIGRDVTIGPGCVIGPNTIIGDHASIGANTVIEAGVEIGANTVIGPLCSISHALVGSRVIIHRGVHIGQDGFGFALGRDGHVKVPQLGRVIIGNEVEIGSNTTIDRGTGPDTIIGDGSKIDNLVQIGHNVQVGRRAVIVAQVGISGSTRVGDGAVLGGQVGLAGHLKIGAGAKIAAQSGVMNDIPPGESYGGSPAVPIVDWHRQTVAVSRLIKVKRGTNE